MFEDHYRHISKQFWLECNAKVVEYCNFFNFTQFYFFLKILIFSTTIFQTTRSFRWYFFLYKISNIYIFTNSLFLFCYKNHVSYSGWDMKEFSLRTLLVLGQKWHIPKRDLIIIYFKTWKARVLTWTTVNLPLKMTNG